MFKLFLKKLLCIIIIFAACGALVYGCSYLVSKYLPENASGYLQTK